MQELITKEGRSLTLSVNNSTGAAIDHNYQREEEAPYYLSKEMKREDLRYR